MATIKFACSECGVRLKSSSDSQGSTIDCPKCGASIAIPDSLDEVDETNNTEPAPEQPTPRIKAPWEYAKEWDRVRFGLLLCAIAAIITAVELAGGEITDWIIHRAYTPTEIYIGLVIGLLIGAFRIYAKLECRHVPQQWVSRPLLYVCVGIESVLLIVVIGTAISLASTSPPKPVENDLPPELKKVLSPSEQEEILRQARQLRDLHAGTPARREPYVRVVSFGFGLATLLSGLISILWPIYLKELADSVKEQDAWDYGDRILQILGPAFVLWVLSVTIYQFMASVTDVPGVYRPMGKSVTVLGLLTIQTLLIRIYWRLRISLRAKSRLKKPKTKLRAASGKA